MYDKTINMYIFEGNPNGRIMCELSNWDGRVYKISRNELDKCSDRLDLKHTGIYFLIGVDENLNRTIYVGEAEETLKRIKQHIKESEIWNDCIAVISKDNELNKAHVKYLENKFYNIAKDVNSYKLVNKSEPTCSTISEYDEAMLEEFIDNTKLLVSTLGIKAFSKAIESQDRDKVEIFYLKGPREADATGSVVSDGFVVFKGSKIANDVTPTMHKGSLKMRESLINNGIVDSNFKLTTDYVFSSPSQAADIVLGRSANGRTEWKNKNNKTINDLNL